MLIYIEVHKTALNDCLPLMLILFTTNFIGREFWIKMLSAVIPSAAISIAKPIIIVIISLIYLTLFYLFF